MTIAHKPRAVLTLGLAAFLGACGSTRDLSRARVYPANAGRDTSLDVQVIREDGRLRGTNTSARSFGPSTVWLNMRYGREIAGWGVGEEIKLNLEDFYDEFGEPFPAGGFFARELSDDVVLVQVEEGGKLAGLTIVNGQGRRR
ncbi:MAG TPA: hypothetical protein VD971_05480 [Phycisphaerales bacterium]|nr:hypothetical protein [Phycisphaerales bacterium]